jgi:hypothetical protein
MLEAVPLLAVTLVFISIFAYSYASLELEEIKASWNERRCEPLILVTAALIQIDPKRDKTEVATENFEFCIGRIIDSSISIFLSPMLKLFNEQIDATKPINDSMKYLRGMAASLMKPLMDVFTRLWDKFMLVVYQAARIFFKLYSAMDRIFGIATASVFAGMSMYKAIQNAMGFVIQVIIAILIILCVLVIFLFFIMWPVIPLILTMIGILSTTVYAANVSGMSGNFCVAPSTLVKTINGIKKVSEIMPGDLLEDGVVEGVMKVENGGACVNIDGIIISKTHLVFHNNSWIFAGKHPLAIDTNEVPPILYCLNTSSRVWTVMGDQSEIILRDWEELPESDEISFAWETLVYKMLNGREIAPLRASALGRGLLGEDTVIHVKGKGDVPIHSVLTGDYVKDKRGYTRVIGTYHDNSEMVPRSGPNSSAWQQKNGVWTHPRSGSFDSGSLASTEGISVRTGFHLVTESGTFFTQDVLTRDFTEVGANRIQETYSFTESFLNGNVNGQQ